MMEQERKPVDWYDAFGLAVYRLGKKWPDSLTDDEYDYREREADALFPRPEGEE